MVNALKDNATSYLLIGIIWLFFILGIASLVAALWFWYYLILCKDAWYFVYSIPFLSFGLINCGATFKGMYTYFPFNKHRLDKN